MQERWIADRAMLQQLIQKHPEWTQQELADWIGRSLGWVKKWVKRLREVPPGDARVLFGKPFGRKTPYAQTDPEVEERILSIRDAPPENLKRTPGPRAILYYLPRDPQLQHRTETLPRSTRTIWKILQRNDRIAHEKRRKRKPVERPLALEEIQMDAQRYFHRSTCRDRQAAACRRSFQFHRRRNLDPAGCTGPGGFSRSNSTASCHPFLAALWLASQNHL